MDAETLKQKLGRMAVDNYVRSNMRIGLGTGSTAIWAIRHIGDLIQQKKLSNIAAVSTSFETTHEAWKYHIPLDPLEVPWMSEGTDITIDGADAVDSKGAIIKGGGAALLNEKIAAYSTAHYVIIVDEQKICERLDAHTPIAVEVVPQALATIMRHFRAMDIEAVLRAAVHKRGPIISDNGNCIVDVTFKQPFIPHEMEIRLNSIPGVVENGLFTQCARTVLIGRSTGDIDVRTYEK